MPHKKGKKSKKQDLAIPNSQFFLLQEEGLGDDKAIEDKMKNLMVVENNNEEKSMKKRNSMTRELNSVSKEKDAIQKDKDAMKVERDDLRKTQDLFKNEGISLKEDYAALLLKYNILTTKLRDQVECPVCLDDVPTSGPVHVVCPNGHFVWSKCKSVNCPTCRVKMLSGKSLLLSISVIENVEHKCRHEDCEVVLPLEDYKYHLKWCPQRIVYCPSPREYCGKEMALSKVYEHILEDCEGSADKDCKALDNNNMFPNSMIYPIGLPNQSGTGVALCWKGIYFYLSFEKIPNFFVFTIQHFGNAEESQEYEVNIAVHRKDDTDMNGKYVQRFSGEPLPIDMSQELRKQNGLIIGSIQMEKIDVKKKNEAKFMFARENKVLLL